MENPGRGRRDFDGRTRHWGGEGSISRFARILLQAMRGSYWNTRLHGKNDGELPVWLHVDLGVEEQPSLLVLIT